MMNTLTVKTLAGLALAGALLLSASCGKDSKPDASKFTTICEETVKCDAQTQGFPDPVKICTQFMVSIEAKFPEKLPDLQKCLQDQPCEKKNFAECLAGVAQGMGMGMPMPQ